MADKNIRNKIIDLTNQAFFWAQNII